MMLPRRAANGVGRLEGNGTQFPSDAQGQTRKPHYRKEPHDC
jgi:hypothetical protein